MTSTRRASAKEVAPRRKVEHVEDRPRRGRPPKKASEKYRPLSIRVDPRVIEWAKKEARSRGVGYQTVINLTLLRACVR